MAADGSSPVVSKPLFDQTTIDIGLGADIYNHEILTPGAAVEGETAVPSAGDNSYTTLAKQTARVGVTAPTGQKGHFAVRIGADISTQFIKELLNSQPSTLKPEDAETVKDDDVADGEGSGSLCFDPDPTDSEDPCAEADANGDGIIDSSEDGDADASEHMTIGSNGTGVRGSVGIVGQLGPKSPVTLSLDAGISFNGTDGNSFTTLDNSDDAAKLNAGIGGFARFGMGIYPSKYLSIDINLITADVRGVDLANIEPSLTSINFSSGIGITGHIPVGKSRVSNTGTSDAENDTRIENDILNPAAKKQLDERLEALAKELDYKDAKTMLSTLLIDWVDVKTHRPQESGFETITVGGYNGGMTYTYKNTNDNRRTGYEVGDEDQQGRDGDWNDVKALIIKRHECQKEGNTCSTK